MYIQKFLKIYFLMCCYSVNNKYQEDRSNQKTDENMFYLGYAFNISILVAVIWC